MDSRCPRKLKCLPSEPCPEGRKAIDAARRGEEGGCPWFIADAESGYCFFRYMADNGNKPIPPQRIARLLLIDDSDVKKTVQSFRKIAAETQEE